MSKDRELLQRCRDAIAKDERHVSELLDDLDARLAEPHEFIPSYGYSEGTEYYSDNPDHYLKRTGP